MFACSIVGLLYGIRICEKDKEASNLCRVLQRKPLRKWPLRRSRIAEDKIQIYLRKIAYEIGRTMSIVTGHGFSNQRS